MKKRSNIIQTVLLLLAFALLVAGGVARLGWQRANPYIASPGVQDEIEVSISPETRQFALSRIAEYEARLAEEELATSTRIGVLVGMAAQNELIGRVAAADSYMDAARELGPNSPSLYVTQSRIKYARGDYDAALDLAQTAIDLRASMPQSWRWYAELDENIRRYGSTDSIYDQALVETNYDPDVVFDYTGYLVRNDRNAEAITVWEQYGERYPTQRSVAEERIKELR